jgi:hypothetical protein
MKFTKEMADAVGLVVGGKSGTALVNPNAGFEGRRLYIDAAPPFAVWKGKTLHLSGLTPEESELLGATPNQLVTTKKGTEYFASSRISGFLPLTQENLVAAAEIVRDATGPAWSRSGAEVTEDGVEVAGLFAAIAASK